MNPFARHIAACNNIRLPGGLLPFRIGEHAVGWVRPAVAAALQGAPGVTVAPDAVTLADPPAPDPVATRSAALASLAAPLAAQRLLRLRREPFDVRATPDGPVLATLDRGALPAFGIAAAGVHVNGLVRRPDGLHVWVGIRARTKAVAPGQVDNLVGGGICAGMDATATVLKEAEEEASLPPALAGQARLAGRIAYVMALPEGLRRDLLHCFDLDLPEDVIPRPRDGEVERFELWPAMRLLAAVRDGDEVKFNVNLVLIDLFLREGLIDPGSAEGRALRAGLDQPE